MQSAALQKEFHRRADSRRFWNRLGNPFLQPKERRLSSRVVAALPAGATRVLEVGCGEGGMLHYLREQRPDIRWIGIDFSPAKAAFLDGNCPAVAAVCGDALRLPFAAGRFDAVIYRDVLHHVNWARREVLEEGLRIARAGGVVIVIESNGRTPLNRLFQWLTPAERGLRDSTARSLVALGSALGNARLEYVEASFLVRAVGYVVGWPDGARRWLARIAYAAAVCWERTVEALVPRRGWTYMMMSVRRG